LGWQFIEHTALLLVLWIGKSAKLSPFFGTDHIECRENGPAILYSPLWYAICLLLYYWSLAVLDVAIQIAVFMSSLASIFDRRQMGFLCTKQIVWWVSISIVVRRPDFYTKPPTKLWQQVIFIKGCFLFLRRC